MLMENLVRVLILDEVLAVNDASAKKITLCYSKRFESHIIVIQMIYYQI